MNNGSCVENIHQYGLWNINNEGNKVWRVCDKCGFKRELPVTEEVIVEINKQKEAAKIFNAFQLVDDTDINIINYLELILEDYVNYLSNTDFKLLAKRIKKLDDLDIIDAKTILYLNRLETCFVVDNIETTNNDFMYQDENTINIEFYEKG